MAKPRLPPRNPDPGNTNVASTGTTRAPLPLGGKRVLVSRARRQAGALSEGLRQLGARVLEIPFIEIRPPQSFRPLDEALREIPNYDWLILTSVNGVQALFARMEKLRQAISTLDHLKVAAIGPATKSAIEKRGLAVYVVPKEYIAESVVESLRSEVAGQRVLLVRAKIARDVIPTELRRLSATVDVIEAYETVVPEAAKGRLLAALKDPRKRPDVITFTSSSTARNFVDLLGKRALHSRLLEGIMFASIGPVTSATLKELGLRSDIEAAEYTIPGLVSAIASQFGN
jgi:uroporphyrinogen-III synthase